MNWILYFMERLRRECGEQETVLILSDNSAMKALRDLQGGITSERHTLSEVEDMVPEEEEKG